MKKIIISAISLSSLLLMTSCGDFLDRKPKTTVPFSELYSTAASAEEAINACYDPIGHERQYLNVFMALDCAAADGEVSGENNGTDMSGAQDIMLYKALPTNDYTTQFFRVSYVALQRVNNFLENTTDVSYNANRMRGEAYFLRGFYYFNLVNIFGPVPLLTKPALSDVFTNPPSNRQTDDDEKGTKQMEAIYDQIISDFDSAALLLPTRTQIAKGRATKGAAWAYLAKAYAFEASLSSSSQMFTSKDPKTLWTKVREYANKVTNEGGGYALESDYHKIFTLEGENSAESIFEIQFIAGGEYGEKSESTIRVIDMSPRKLIGYSDYYGYGIFSPAIALHNVFDIKNTNGTITHWDKSWSLKASEKSALIKSAKKLLTNYKDYDPRLDLIAKPGDSVYFSGEWLYTKSKDAATGSWIRKATPPVGRAASKTEGLNYMMYRYADLLLIQAEAEFALGDGSKAASLVEQVRERARKSRWEFDSTNKSSYNFGYKIAESTTPAYLSSVTVDQIRDERRRELYGEGIRFFDIVRWGIATTVCTTREAEFVGRTFSWSSDKVRLPLPAVAIADGKGNIVQNPGY